MRTAALGVVVLACIVVPASAATYPPTISKSFGAAAIPLNGTTTLTFTITNPGANTVAENGVAFFDAFPAGLVVASTPGTTNTCGGTVVATANSSSVSLTGGTIAADSSCSVTVNVTGTTRGMKNNTSGAVSSTNGGTGTPSNTASLSVGQPALSKSFGSAAIPLNGTTTLTFTITNTDPSSGITFSDTLPAGLVVATPNSLSGSCGGGTITANAGSNTISLSGATLAASASCSFSVNVTGTTPGVKTNTTGNISSTEGGTGRTASASLTVSQPPPPAQPPPPSSTAITKAKINKKKHKGTFSFSATNATSFQCALVKHKKKGKHFKRPKATFRSCSSPKTYNHLKPGKYTFEVRGVNSAGPDPNPAAKKFKI